MIGMIVAMIAALGTALLLGATPRRGDSRHRDK